MAKCYLLSEMMERCESGHDTHTLTDQVTVGWKTGAVMKTRHTRQINRSTVSDPTVYKKQSFQYASHTSDYSVWL